MTERFDRIVVGGGAMGLATAWNLAKQGVRVLLLERFAQGHDRGASHGQTRNLNDAYAQEHYLDLFDEAVDLWRELEGASGTRILTLCGLVSHGEPRVVREAHAALAARGRRTELIGPAEAAERWPGMRFEGEVLVNPGAGRVQADAALAALAAEIAKHGGDLRFEHRVTGISETDGGAVVTAVDERAGADGAELRFAAPGVVVAAGAWTRSLLDGIVDLPRLTVTEEHPAHFRVREELLGADAEAAWPSFNHFRMHVPGGDWECSAYGMLSPGEGIKVGFHLVGDEVDPDARRFRSSDALRAALHAYVAEWFPGLDADTAVEMSCTYTSTESEDFMLDRFGAITVGAGFSGHGFKFTPAIGRVLADASLGRALPPEPFRRAAH